MYQYNEQDRRQLKMRLSIFQKQLERHERGELSDEAFRPLRLQNGLYIQRHAPMLRVAVPYGLLSSPQLNKLAFLASTYDQGYVHITTRQNIQFNWPSMTLIPDILNHLAEVDMHTTQTSGNCIRNITSDPFAGVAPDEVVDPRPYCEIIRQWSTGHPEFAFLPRKFKIAVSGSRQDRALVEAHDIGLQAMQNQNGKVGFVVWVGGGLGRTPMMGSIIRDFLPEQDLLTYLHGIVQVYNQFGRRDNKYKARIKILLKDTGLEHFKALVEEAYGNLKLLISPLSDDDLKYARSFFSQPEYQAFDSIPDQKLAEHCQADQAFARWVHHNTHSHKVSGYRAVTLSLKRDVPGDIQATQLQTVARLAERYSFGEVRTTHQQNIVFADVRIFDLYPLWQALSEVGLATPNIGTVTDMICCPGLDYCSLASAPSIFVAQGIQKRFEDLDYLYDIGELTLNISGCVNACAHHHLANIGILGVDKKGEPYYQISLGGRKSPSCQTGKVLGPAFSKAQIAPVIERIIHIYLQHRQVDESFITTFDRIGLSTFKESLYGRSA